MPADVALYATRILARGDLTPEAVRRMEDHVDRAVDELAATGVDVVAYCDMVTTFVMQPGWNETKVAEIAKRTGTLALSAWTALRDALSALNVRRFALGTPYPRAVHALAAPFFAERGHEIVGEATLDIVSMRDVPTVSENRAACVRRRASTRPGAGRRAPGDRSADLQINRRNRADARNSRADVEPDHSVACAAFHRVQ